MPGRQRHQGDSGNEELLEPFRAEHLLYAREPALCYRQKMFEGLLERVVYGLALGAGTGLVLGLFGVVLVAIAPWYSDWVERRLARRRARRHALELVRGQSKMGFSLHPKSRVPPRDEQS